MANPAYATPGYRKGRARLLAGDPVCVHCRTRPATEADHQPPLRLHAHQDGTACCELVPSCSVCARRQGAILAGRGPAPRAVAPPTSITAAPAPIEPVGYPPADPVWDVPWLESLRDVPADATWPRLMTRPHPRAEGSYGDAFAAYVARTGEHPLRWWQTLTATRLLEHDADGVLVWPLALVSTARQVGKSLLLRELCRWRLESAGELFTPGQLVLHVARKLAVAAEVQRPARRWARADPDRWKVRELNGDQQIERRDDGSRWMVRAKNNVVSFTADLVVIDEAWDVSAVQIETDLIPTLVEHQDTQLLMWSTAHRLATSLVMNRRATLDVTDPAAGLHVEWSAPRDADLDDRAGWRMASPHWTERREELIATRLAAARTGETDDPDEPDPTAAFTSQWLNWWPTTRRQAGPGEPLLAEGAWAACVGSLADSGPGVVAIEDNWGHGAAAAFAATDGAGRYEVDGAECDDWEAAIALARRFVLARPGARLVVGISLRSQVPADFPNVSAMRIAGPTEVHRALPLLRALVAAGQVVHEARGALDDQIAAARVRQLPSGGLSLLAKGRADLLKAALYALDAVQVTPPTPAVR